MSDPCIFVGVEGEKCDKLHQLLKDNPCRPTARPKRAPSTYNLYVKECIKNKGGIKKFGEAAPIMRQCASEYREDKAKGQFRYKFEVPVPQSTGNPQLWKGRNLQAEYRDLYRRVSGRSRK